MAHQSLDHDEVLNVRWATVDPNPAAQKREARRVEDQAAEAIRRALPASYIAELEGRDGDAAKRRKLEGSFGLDGYEAPDDIWYAKEMAQNGRDADQFPSRGTGENGVDASLNGAPTQTNGTEQTSKTNFSLGILSQSTVAALQQLGSGQRLLISSIKPVNDDPGSLVAYGSDDD